MLAEVMMLDYTLRKWRAQPELPKREYSAIVAWQNGSEANELPLGEEEVARKKARLREIAPSAYFRIFPDAEPDSVLSRGDS